METLINKYKLVIIPKNTILFRKAKDNKVYESMFFSFDFYGTGSSDYNDKPIQLWVTKVPIISRLIVSGSLNSNIYLSDLNTLYKIFSGENKHELDIKSRHNPNRKAFLQFLKLNKIDSWVTSVEDNTCNELHLFTDKNNNLVRFKKIITHEKNPYLSRKDSFENLILIDLNNYL